MSRSVPARNARFPAGLEPAASAPPKPGLLRPQRPLREAALDAKRSSATQGLGLDSPPVRLRMVERLRAEGLQCEPVLAAMASVPRHLFVDSALAAQAYEDTSLPIGLGQTISKPSVVARMLALLLEGRDSTVPRPLGRVLEIGTGCGYQAALLSLLATQVISVERLRPLHDKARELLAPLRRDNLRLVYGDGCLGHPPNAPYDTIIAAAGGADVPEAWLEQLAPGGRLVAPTQIDGGPQVLITIDRQAGGCVRRVREAVNFVPLRSGTA